MNVHAAWMLARGAFATGGLRLALTLASIALGVALATAVHTLHASALAEIDRSARALAGEAELEVRGPRSGFDDALFLAVAARDEVALASPVVEVEAMVPTRDAALRVLGIDVFRAARLQPGFAAGAASAQGSLSLLDRDALWLSPAAAARLGVRAGDSVPLATAAGTRDFRIGGLLPALEAGGAFAVMDIAAAQAHFGRLGRLSRIELALRPGTDRRAFRSTLSATLPPGVVVDEKASVAVRATALTRAYRTNLDALALVALATGAFLVFSTLALQAAHRRRELSTLRALGVTRRGLVALLGTEGALLGLLGSAIGLALGLGASRWLLSRSGADLGAGFFGGQGGHFAPGIAALVGIALLGVGTATAGALQVARGVARIPVAEGLRDRSLDVAAVPRRSWRSAALLFAAGIPFLFAPPWGDIPLGGYAGIAFWLAAAIATVGPLSDVVLARVRPASAVAGTALAQLRDLPGHLAASVAGIVVSASLCVAMAILVFSFRTSLETWLHGVVGADLYVRASSAGDAASFDTADEHRLRGVPGVAAVEMVRYDRLVLAGTAAPLSLVARPLDAAILRGFQADPPGMPPAAAEVAVWISEAARDLHGWRTGERIVLPIAGREVPARIAGTIRDYARTWGAVLMPLEDYRRLSGDMRANDAALHLAPGADAGRVREAVRAALGDRPALELEDAAGLRARSLALFDRSFAVTYALEAIAIAIGLAGMTSSFAAIAWSRRREFGVLRFLGFRRGEVLRMLLAEGAAVGTLGAAIGLVAGVAISVVLVQVVNRQSFHWTLALHWPVVPIAIFLGALVLACALGARASGGFAARREAMLAVKEDA